jgi:phosphoglycolate phosphatase-like HAD superfamily hydrolase
MQRVRGRIDDLESGRAAPEEWTVPGSHALLQKLRERGVALYLASGTDVAFVRREVALLGLEPFFAGRIYGALDNYQDFSKKMIVDKILRDNDLSGPELLGFGDGFVEIEEVRRAGGVAVAVASDEVARCGVNQWKRNRLIEAGADIVIPEYRKHQRLLNWLFDEA